MTFIKRINFRLVLNLVLLAAALAGTPAARAAAITGSIGNFAVNEDAPVSNFDLSTVFTGAENYLLLTNSAPNILTASLVGSALKLTYLANANGSANVTIVATNPTTAVTNTFTVTVNPVADAPTISAPSPTFTINDNTTNFPFANVTITNVDGPATLMDVTVQLANPLKGTFIGSAIGTGGFSVIGSDTNAQYVMTGATGSNLTVKIRQLVFKPASDQVAVGSSEVLPVSIAAQSTVSQLATTNNATQITVVSVNDPPTIAGTTPGSPQLVFSSQTSQPFGQVSINDPDVTAVPDQGQLLVLSITTTGDPGGQLQYTDDSGFARNGNVIALTNYQGELNNQIQALVFQASGATLSTVISNTFIIQVTDPFGAKVTNSDVVVQTATPFVSPDINGVVPNQTLDDNHALQPFTQVTIRGSGSKVQLRILRESDLASCGDQFGTMTNLGTGGFVKVGTGNTAYYEMANTTMDDATTRIRTLAFKPNENQVASPTKVLFEIKLIDDSNNVLGKDSQTSISIQPVNDLPSVLGAMSGQYINDQQVIRPFLTRTNPAPTLVRIADVDEGGLQHVNVAVQLDNNQKGTFTNYASAGFSLSGGQYIITNVTPADASAALQQLVFQPTANRNPPSYSETVRMSLLVDDGQGFGIVSNGLTTVIVTGVNDMPVISLAPSNVVSAIVTDVIKPFAASTITDPDRGTETLTVTVSLDDAGKGTFSTLGGFTNSPGYTYIGSPTRVTADFQALVFNPNPGYTPPQGQSSKQVNFTITARDLQNATFTTNLVLNLIATNRTWIVTSTNDSGTGSLREMVANARSGDQIVFNITNLPATINLNTEIAIGKPVRINGPGAEKVTISGDSNNDGVPDVRIFHLTNSAIVSISGLTLTRGSADFFGGAISAETMCQLSLAYCTLSSNIAGQWGGAVDISGGSLQVANCLFVSNSVTAALGQGGGAISLYTDFPCRVENSTFSGNSLAAARGFGGGAIYAENMDVGNAFPVLIANCTFSGNSDAAGFASSVRANSFDTYVWVQNNIFADGAGYNLSLDSGAQILSLGGNISDDATRIIFSQGGDPFHVTILTNATDLVSTNPKLLPLADNGGPTWTHALATNSPAISHAISNALAADQRGFLRTLPADSGAYESGVYSRVFINEIMFNPAAGSGSQFIEFVNARYSKIINLVGYTVWVDGTLVHTFTSVALDPAAGVVLGASPAVVVPVAVPIQYPNGSSGALNLSPNTSTVVLKNPAGQEVASVTYNGLFGSSNSLLYDESINLSPEFYGFAYVPFTVVPTRTAGTSSPGSDAVGTPLVKGNAPPRAIDDLFATDQNTTTNLTVLANDIELDPLDTIRVVWATNSLFGATVTIGPDGQSVIYNPNTSVALRSLPVGSMTNDTFQYSIIDSYNSVDWPMTGLNYTGLVTVAVTGLNDAPTPQTDTNSPFVNLTTLANQLFIINVQSNLLVNDTDPDTDDNSGTLLISSVFGTSNYVSSMVTTSALGAVVTLDIRADRNQSRILYDGRNATNLIALFQGQLGVDRFWYSVVDRHGAIGQALVYVNVIGTNEPPIAQPDWLATDQKTPFKVPATQLLGNDYDPDNAAAFTLLSVSPLSSMGAAVTFDGTNVNYNPLTSTNIFRLSRKELATDTYTYRMTDGYGTYSTGLVSVVVTGRNDLPIALPDFYATDEDVPFAIGATNGVLVNDYDPDVNGITPDDTIRVLAFTNHYTPAGALVTMNLDGSFTFDPNHRFDWLTPGQSTTETFTYTLVDNSMTVAMDDEFLIQAGSKSNTIPVLANDALLSQTYGNISISAVGTPDRSGKVFISADKQTLIYSPAQDYLGVETVVYTMTDGQGRQDTATVRFHVLSTAVNRQLAATPDNFTVAAGTTALLKVLPNDYVSGAAGASLTIASVSAGDKGGSIAITGTGPDNFLTYTPAAGVSYPYYENFTYVVQGGDLGTATGNVTVKVVDRSQVVPLSDDAFVVGANSSANILNVVTNDHLFTGIVPPLTITSVQATNLIGAISIDVSNNCLRYTPAQGSNDYTEVPIYYTVTDGVGGTGSAKVSVAVHSVGMFAVDNYFTVAKNSSNLFLPVLSNDVALPASGKILSVISVGIDTNTPSNGGLASVDASGLGIRYTPAANFAGDESFTYEITDGSLARAAARIRIKVLDVSTVPSNPDAYAVAWNSPSNVFTVLDNDYVLPRGSSKLSVVGLLTSGLRGTVRLLGSGPDNSLLYVPANNFIGKDTFNYICMDENGNRGTNTVTVTVASLYGVDDNFSVVSDTVSNRLDVLANDAFFPNTNVVRKIFAVGATDHGGLVTTNATGDALVYSPSNTFTGSESFTYQVADDHGTVYTQAVAVTVIPFHSDRTNGLVTVTIRGINHPPIARDDQVATDEVSPLVIPFATLLANDEDEDSPVHFRAVALTSSLLGVAITTNNLNVIYDPRTATNLQALANGGTVRDTFVYTIADDQGLTNTATVTVLVSSLRSALVVWRQQHFDAATLANPALEATVWGDNADPDQDGLSNRAEYLLGSDPNNAASRGQLVLANSLRTDLQQFSVTFRRRQNDPAIVSQVDVSTDSHTWRNGQSQVLSERTVPLGGDFEAVTWILAKPTNQALFYRVNMR